MDLVAEWKSLIKNPFFNDIPHKVALNKFGQILMNLRSNWHGITRYSVGKAIERVADLAWASDKFIAEFGEKTPYPKASAICIEIKSSANSQAEMDEKIRLYLEKRALEVWIVGENNVVSFYTHIGKIEKSKIAGNFKL